MYDLQEEWLNGLKNVTKDDICLLSSHFVVHGATKLIINQVLHGNLNSLFIVSVAWMLYSSEVNFPFSILGSVFVCLYCQQLCFHCYWLYFCISVVCGVWGVCFLCSCCFSPLSSFYFSSWSLSLGSLSTTEFVWSYSRWRLFRK